MEHSQKSGDLRVVAALGREFERVAERDRGRRRPRALPRLRRLAVVTAVALLALTALTAPGKDAAAWMGRLVGIGEVGGSPTQKRHGFEDKGARAAPVVIDNGLAPDGTRYEWVAFRCKVDLRDEGQPNRFRGYGLSLDWPTVKGTRSQRQLCRAARAGRAGSRARLLRRRDRAIAVQGRGQAGHGGLGHRQLPGGTPRADRLQRCARREARPARGLRPRGRAAARARRGGRAAWNLHRLRRWRAGRPRPPGGLPRPARPRDGGRPEPDRAVRRAVSRRARVPGAPRELSCGRSAGGRRRPEADRALHRAPAAQPGGGDRVRPPRPRARARELSVPDPGPAPGADPRQAALPRPGRGRAREAARWTGTRRAGRSCW